MRAVTAGIAVLLAAAGGRAAEYGYVDFGTAGRVACTAVPNGWQANAFDDTRWTIGEPAVDAGAACAGTRYTRWRFDIGPESARLRTLTLRIKYAHGFAAYLNGVEIARQRLAPDADAAALANDWHDLEAERISIPVRADLIHSGTNVLAVEVHARTAGKQPWLNVELRGGDAARIVRGPYLEAISARQVTVVLDTDLPTTATVRWGASSRYGAQAADDTARTHHALKLTGLDAATAYHYRVEATDVGGKIDAGDAYFHTPPGNGGVLRFIAYGDTRSGHDVHAQLDKQMASEDPDFAIVTGDLVGRGSDEGDWERFFEIAAAFLRQVSIFPAPGNHEYGLLGKGVDFFTGFFRPSEALTPSYYSFDEAGVHFVALDSNQYTSPAQWTWLDADLTAAEKRHPRAVFVYAHEAPYTMGPHGGNAVCLKSYVPIMVRHHVAMFFGGHDHHYERGRVGPLNYIITGGGGAELRAPKCGLAGLPACPPTVFDIAKDYNYVLVEVLGRSFRVCAKRPDGSAIEPCATIPLPR